MDQTFFSKLELIFETNETVFMFWMGLLIQYYSIFYIRDDALYSQRIIWF